MEDRITERDQRKFDDICKCVDALPDAGDRNQAIWTMGIAADLPVIREIDEHGIRIRLASIVEQRVDEAYDHKQKVEEEEEHLDAYRRSVKIVFERTHVDHMFVDWPLRNSTNEAKILCDTAAHALWVKCFRLDDDSGEGENHNDDGALVVCVRMDEACMVYDAIASAYDDACTVVLGPIPDRFLEEDVRCPQTFFKRRRALAESRCVCSCVE